MIDLSKKRQYAYSEVIPSGQNGQTIQLFPRYKSWKPIRTTLHAGSNTGKFQASTSWDNETYSLPTVIKWFDVPLESNTGTVPDAIVDPITALRGASISGEIEIEVVI